MQTDEEFSGYAKPDMYPLFHEAMSLPIVREWLGWNEAESTFTKKPELEHFYSLHSPTGDDSPKAPAKITTYGEVRELKYILGTTRPLQSWSIPPAAS
jgi:hypothetical protein